MTSTTLLNSGELLALTGARTPSRTGSVAGELENGLSPAQGIYWMQLTLCRINDASNSGRNRRTGHGCAGDILLEGRGRRWPWSLVLAGKRAVQEPRIALDRAEGAGSRNSSCVSLQICGFWLIRVVNTLSSCDRSTPTKSSASFPIMRSTLVWPD